MRLVIKWWGSPALFTSWCHYLLFLSTFSFAPTSWVRLQNDFSYGHMNHLQADPHHLMRSCPLSSLTTNLPAFTAFLFIMSVYSMYGVCTVYSFLTTHAFFFLHTLCQHFCNSTQTANTTNHSIIKTKLKVKNKNTDKFLINTSMPQRKLENRVLVFMLLAYL